MRSQFDQNRLEANRELVKLLTIIVEEQPTQRFSQILRNYDFISELDINNYIESWSGPVWNNEFHAEPQAILKRVKKRLNEQKITHT